MLRLFLWRVRRMAEMCPDLWVKSTHLLCILTSHTYVFIPTTWIWKLQNLIHTYEIHMSATLLTLSL